MKSILIVEDEKGIQEIIKEELKDLQCHIGTVETATKARQVLSEQDIDLIVSDINLAMYENGIEFIRQIRKDNPSQDIIVISGNIQERGIMNYFKRNSITYLTKPFEVEELKKLVQEYLEK